MLEARAVGEAGAMLASIPWLNRLPKGDGHPVLVFPGLTANDLSTKPLRGFLDRLGYATQGWGQGFNRGPRSGVLARCTADAMAMHEKHGRAVSLVGWSLGGLYAREVAKALPGQTRCVVTLGTPFAGDLKANNAWRAFQWLSGHSAPDASLVERLSAPPPVPTTSIYSRSDGIVSWRSSLNAPAALAENIEVPASHLGMAMNPLALYALADRLAQPEGAWRPFEARGLRRWFFRTGAAGR